MESDRMAWVQQAPMSYHGWKRCKGLAGDTKGKLPEIRMLSENMSMLFTNAEASRGVCVCVSVCEWVFIMHVYM